MAMRSFSLPDQLSGSRVDALVRRYLPELSDAQVRSVFAHRDVKVDGKRVKPDVRVFLGQEVTVFYMEPSSPALDVVYEDADVLLVNKRAGFSVEPDDGGGVSVKELAARHVGGSFQPVPCHRLDNQTSGLLLFAKNEASALVLEDVFRRRTLAIPVLSAGA